MKIIILSDDMFYMLYKSIRHLTVHERITNIRKPTPETFIWLDYKIIKQSDIYLKGN